MKNWLKNEFTNGQSKTDWFFLALGLLIQIIAIIFTCISPDGMTTSQIVWTSISGLTGIAAVVFCAQGKLSFYIFGFIQLFTYVFAVAIPEHLWGEVGENVFYFITMIIGMVIWWKNYNKDSAVVKSKVMTKLQWIVSIIILIISTIGLAIALEYTNDPLPWFDSITTTAPFIAQILLMLDYRDQWAFWIIEDILSLGMFIVLNNWIMVAQYLFWTINCIYGWIKWTKFTTK